MFLTDSYLESTNELGIFCSNDSLVFVRAPYFTRQCALFLACITQQEITKSQYGDRYSEICPCQQLYEGKLKYFDFYFQVDWDMYKKMLIQHTLEQLSTIKSLSS